MTNKYTSTDYRKVIRDKFNELKSENTTATKLIENFKEANNCQENDLYRIRANVKSNTTYDHRIHELRDNVDGCHVSE